MELIHTLGIAIDPSAAKSGSAQAAAAFQQVGVAARATGAAAQIATKALGPLGAALGVIKKAVSSIDFEGMVTGLYETSSSLEKLQRQLKFASSDSADFRANFGFLRGVAQELGLEFASTGEAFAKFATAAKGKLSSNQIRDTFVAVAEASVAMGQNTEHTSEVLKVFGEMLGKGAVKADDLRGQLGKELPGVFTLLAQSVRMSEESLAKLLDTGGVMAGELVPKLTKALHEALGPSAAEGAKSLHAEMNRLKNVWTELQMVIMEAGGDSLFSAIINKAREALKGFKLALAGLFQAAKEGTLSEAVAAALEIGIGEGVNYFAGFAKTAAEMLAAAGAKLLTPEAIIGMKLALSGVAISFGLALLNAFSRPIAYLQAKIEHTIARFQPTDPEHLKAQSAIIDDLRANDPRFQGLTAGKLGLRRVTLKDENWQGWGFGPLTPNREFIDAVRQRLRPPTVEETTDQIMAKGGPLAGAIQANEVFLNKSLSLLAKPVASATHEIALIGAKFQKADLVNTANAKKKLFSLGEHWESLLVQEPPAPTLSGANPPLEGKSSAPLPEPFSYERSSFIPFPLTLSREVPTQPEPAAEPPTPSLFARFREGLQQGTEGFTEAVQQMRTAGAETARALTSDFADFFTSSIEGTKSLGAAFRDMASSILRDIERILVHRLIAEPIVGAITHTLGLPTTKSHHGGLVGAGGGMSTLVNPLLFLGAPRLHQGLAPDEFPAILQRGERVVPKSQAGAWGRGGGDININVNVDGSRGGTPAQNKAFGAEVARQIEAMVDARIARAAMPRGILRPAASYA